MVPVSWGDAGVLVDRRSWLDVDGDWVPDVVEEGLCGSATCARPDVDVDGDGIPDWVEWVACGSASCASAVDSDRDCVPDYVNLVLCGLGKCSVGVLHGDGDGDGVENWVEVVVAGDFWHASPMIDRDGNGVPDVVEVAGCVAAPMGGGVAGSGWLGWLAGVVVVCGSVLGGWLLVGRRTLGWV